LGVGFGIIVLLLLCFFGFIHWLLGRIKKDYQLCVTHDDLKLQAIRFLRCCHCCLFRQPHSISQREFEDDPDYDVIVQGCRSFFMNYSYAVVNKVEKSLIIIDPLEPEDLIKLLQEYNYWEDYTIAGVLITHHHPDHDGGLYKFKSAPLYSCRNLDVIDQTALLVGGFMIIPLVSNYHVEGHYAFYFTQVNGAPLKRDFIFMGDSLFVGGLGAFLSGTTHDAVRYFHKVNLMIGAHTKLYCGHEYSIRNVAFDCYFLNTHWTENCPDIFEFYYRVYDRRKKRLAVVGITWAIECKFNPFLLLALGKVKDGKSTFNTILREKRRIYSIYTIEDMYRLNQDLEEMKAKQEEPSIELVILDEFNEPESDTEIIYSPDDIDMGEIDTSYE